MTKILVVDDDPIITDLIGAYLADTGALIEYAADGEQAGALLAVSKYDLLILDWVLPDVSGVEICRDYRTRGGRSSILMLTSKSDRYDKAAGLDAGADDYLVKPFDEVEFKARVRALLRRPETWSDKVLRHKDIEINTSNHTVLKAGKEIMLRPREFALLELLLRHPGQNFTAEAIFRRLWESTSNSSVETVRTHVMSLRKKLGDTDQQPLISSNRGLGYKIDI